MTNTAILAWTRHLTPDDLAALAPGGNHSGTQRPNQAIQEIQDSHHRLARLIARGVDASEAALSVGLQPHTAASLQEDPAFCNLVDHYRESRKSGSVGPIPKTEEAQNLDDMRRWIDELNAQGTEVKVEDLLTSLGQDTILALISRMRSHPEDIKTNQMIQLLQSAMNRIGLPDQSGNAAGKSVNINNFLDSGFIDQVRQEGANEPIEVMTKEPEDVGHDDSGG